MIGEDPTEFFDEFAVRCIYNTSSVLDVIADGEAVEPFTDVRSVNPQALCVESALVLDGDSSYRAGAGRTLSFHEDMGTQEHMGGNTYTILDMMTDGTGMVILEFELNF